MTQALKDYEGLEEDGIIEKWFSKESLEKGIIKMEDLISKLNLDNPYRETFEKDLKDKINMSKDLLNNFDFEIIKKMTIMNSHGDYSVQQLIYNDNDKIMMIMRKKDYQNLLYLEPIYVDIYIITQKK